jgi:integrase
MGRKKSPGLRKRGGVWHVDKRVKELQGGRLRESTGTSNLAEAERYLVRRLEEIRQASIYGVRRIRTFEEAATKYLLENTHKASILDDGRHLKQLMPFIGQLPLNKVHDGALEAFKAARKLGGIRTKSINNALQVVRRILNLAARSWRDEHGLTWIETAPLITMLPVRDARKPYPLDWDEQRNFYQRLPGHLARMALYKVNTGTREQEVCQLRWDWEVTVPELETSVFIVPGKIVKNRRTV